MSGEKDGYIEDVMREGVIRVDVATDEEEVGERMREYDFIGVGVVDYENELVGMIRMDEILDVME
ncbi:CBS domain-containing protein, partial [Staphylococcus warneri]|uniref:CBS domain-containing protein n=1 Tax=Staphylococcus warneri TaxID=1292 RepID=UPI0021BDB217